MFLLKQLTSINHIEYCFVKPKIEVINPIKWMIGWNQINEKLRDLGFWVNKAAKNDLYEINWSKKEFRK